MKWPSKSTLHLTTPSKRIEIPSGQRQKASLKRDMLLRQTERLSQEECARLREGVPYVKVCRYNRQHLCPKLNGYGDNGPRKVWSSCGSTYCTCQLTSVINGCPWVWCPMTLAVCLQMCFLQGTLRAAVSCIVLGTLRTTMTWRASFF
jgi:hypothetical protein